MTQSHIKGYIYGSEVTDMVSGYTLSVLIKHCVANGEGIVTSQNAALMALG